MKKTAGFTLIELVIVIVILGILGAVAAPKFLNLQGDAYGANVKSLAGSLQSAATLANTKAILEGKDKATDIDGTAKKITGYDGVKFSYGFPVAATDKTGIFGALQSIPSSNDYVITADPATGTATSVTLQPKSRATDATKCFVKYIAATATENSKVESEATCG